MRSFKYKCYLVRASRNGFEYKSQWYHYTLRFGSGEVYFKNALEARVYIDKICPQQNIKLGNKMNESWIQIISLFVANAGLIIWFRTESRNDWRHMDNKLDAQKNAIDAQINAIRADMKSFQDAMLLESKDFHGRLCKIEEGKK